MMPRNNENQTLFLKINRVSLGMPFFFHTLNVKSNMLPNAICNSQEAWKILYHSSHWHEIKKHGLF